MSDENSKVEGLVAIPKGPGLWAPLLSPPSLLNPKLSLISMQEERHSVERQAGQAGVVNANVLPGIYF